MKAPAPLHTQKEYGYPLAWTIEEQFPSAKLILANVVSLWIQWVVLSDSDQALSESLIHARFQQYVALNENLVAQ